MYGESRPVKAALASTGVPARTPAESITQGRHRVLPAHEVDPPDNWTPPPWCPPLSPATRRVLAEGEVRRTREAENRPVLACTVPVVEVRADSQPHVLSDWSRRRSNGPHRTPDCARAAHQ